MIRAWGYCRVSTEKQLKSTLGVRGYIERVVNYSKDNGLDLGRVTTVSIEGQTFQSRERIIIDAESASKVKFFNRKAIRTIMEARGKDDALVIAKVDRAFRNMRDAFHVTSKLKELKVPLHLVDLAGMNVNLASDGLGALMADLCLAMMAFAAQMESTQMSMRIKDAHDAAKLRGCPITNYAPAGFIFIGKGKHRKMVLDQQQLALFRQIRAWQRAGYGRVVIERTLREMDMEVPGRPHWCNLLHGERPGQTTVRKWIKAAKLFDDIEHATGLKPEDGEPWFDEYRKRFLDKAEERKARNQTRRSDRLAREARKLVECR